MAMPGKGKKHAEKRSRRPFSSVIVLGTQVNRPPRQRTNADAINEKRRPYTWTVKGGKGRKGGTLLKRISEGGRRELECRLQNQGGGKVIIVSPKGSQKNLKTDPRVERKGKKGKAEYFFRGSLYSRGGLSIRSLACRGDTDSTSKVNQQTNGNNRENERRIRNARS